MILIKAFIYLCLFILCGGFILAIPELFNSQKDSTSTALPQNTPTYTPPQSDFQANHGTKTQFLTNNSEFFDLIINNILCSHNPGLSWILEKETSEQYAVRTVFLGYSDIYCFIGTPLEPAFKTDYNFPWPNTFWVMNGGQTTTHYKYQRFTYADHLGFPPISNYQGISRKVVLGWLAEDVRTRFHSLHPELNVSNVKYSIQNSNCYYYFTFTAASKTLSGWK